MDCWMEIHHFRFLDGFLDGFSFLNGFLAKYCIYFKSLNKGNQNESSRYLVFLDINSNKTLFSSFYCQR